jgi:hypothetical protein
MVWWIADAAAVAGLAWLATAAALFLLASSSVALGFLSLWMSDGRRRQALMVLDRLVCLAAALRGKAPAAVTRRAQSRRTSR